MLKLKDKNKLIYKLRWKPAVEMSSKKKNKNYATTTNITVNITIMMARYAKTTSQSDFKDNLSSNKEMRKMQASQKFLSVILK